MFRTFFSFCSKYVVTKLLSRQSQSPQGGVNTMANEPGSRNSTDFRTGVGQTAYKRRLAYDYLGIDPTDVEPVPFLRQNLRRIARCINQGRAKDEMVHLFDYLLSSTDRETRRVWEAYHSVPASYRRLLPPEAFCVAARVSPSHILEVVTAVAVRLGSEASVVVAAIMHPRVVMKTVERALKDEGTRERMMMHKATGCVPTWAWRRS
jgi:hypothetical protein